MKKAEAEYEVAKERCDDLAGNAKDVCVKDAKAAHERAVFEEVTKARTALRDASSPGSAAEANDILSAALGRLFAVAEAYPELKASANFLRLQDDLTDTEDKIAAARRYYNAVVRDLNTTIDSFPSNQVAAFFRFAKREYFELERPEDRQVPRVSFGG